MEFTSKLFYDLYTWVAFQSCKDEKRNSFECNIRCPKLFGYNWESRYNYVRVTTWDKSDEGWVSTTKVQGFAGRVTIMGPLAALLGRSADRHIQKHHPVVDAELINFIVNTEKGLTFKDFDENDRHRNNSSTCQYGGASRSWKRY